MRAIACTAYGPPEVLQLREIDTPTPKESEIRIRVHAAVVGPSDCAFRKGDPFIVKLIYGLAKPKLAIQGVEFAGVVDATGGAVTQFRVGDQVFGVSTDSFGAHAEYLCLPEAKTVIAKPTTMSYAEAVAIGDGAPTALTFLRDVAKLQRGQRILINGASGAVGVYAVQLARYYGAEVTGVCSSANVELVRSLGADHVIDYTSEDFTRAGQTYDVIFDAVGKRSFSECRRALTAHGIYMTTVPTLGIVAQMLWTSVAGGRRAKFAAAGLMQNKENFAFLKELAEVGKLRAVIDRRYPLEQTAEAHRYVDTGRKKGNVVITLGA
jgi:NADPH:quinone reductase-like Zn-dependent oxidoreductase